MCNSGKYIDRSPLIKAAGMVCNCDENITDILKVFPKYELAHAWMMNKHCPIKRPSEFFPRKHILPNVTVQESLAPELMKSHFVKFREQFFEDLYLKGPKLGEAAKVHSIPSHINNVNTTFGTPSSEAESLYSVVFPQKSVSEVNREYVDAHSKYVLSHKHYLPGEKVYRKYNKNFDPKKNFGKSSNIDPTGGQVKRCMVQRDKVILVKELQKYYLDNSFANVGTTIHKFRDPHLTDPKKVFGHPRNEDECRLRDLLHNIRPCEDSDERVNAIAHLIHLRHEIQKDAQFDIFGLEMDLEKNAAEDKGYVPLSVALEIARLHQLHFNAQKIRRALILYKLVENVGKPNERILIEEFSKILQMRFLLPELEQLPIKIVPALDTTYRELCRDRNKPQPIGLTYRKKPIDDLEDDPEYYSFDSLREKGQLQRIFADIVNVEAFEKIWQIAKGKLKPEGDLISINDFRAILTEVRAQCKATEKKD